MNSVLPHRKRQENDCKIAEGRSQAQGAVGVQCGVTWDENRSEKDTVDSSKRIAERKLREGVTIANYLKIEAVE